MKWAKGTKGFWSISCVSPISVAIAFQALTPHNTHGFRARFNLEAGACAGFVDAAYPELVEGYGTPNLKCAQINSFLCDDGVPVGILKCTSTSPINFRREEASCKALK